ncbi:PH domain-containing protein [Microbacterium sp. B2969]|uniref:PH domain-containing protein n=1 Tax=Microbacterium alkaliflavum TaxID=3248839 RepID=A0ABW7QC03_9MICO
MSLFDPRVEKHLIADLGEVVIDEVRKHWAAVVGAMLELFGGVVLLLLVLFVPAPAWWVPVLLGGAVCVHALWRILERHTDRFVITNMRVFRVHGILSQRIATMPLARILDISVHKPIIGRILGYGHFVFESAAQEQGLREIRWVGDPDGRGLTIQRVIQQAGLRGFAGGQPLAGRPVAPEPAAYVAESTPASSYSTLGIPPRPPLPASATVDWLADAQRREGEELRRRTRGSFDPDRTPTAPIDLPR